MNRLFGWACGTGNEMPSEKLIRVALVVVRVFTIAVAPCAEWHLGVNVGTAIGGG